MRTELSKAITISCHSEQELATKLATYQRDMHIQGRKVTFRRDGNRVSCVQDPDRTWFLYTGSHGGAI